MKAIFAKILYFLIAIAVGVCVAQSAKSAPTHEEYTNAVRIVREYRKAHPVKPRRVVRPNADVRKPGQFKAFNLKGEKRYNPVTKKFFIQKKEKKTK